MEARRPQITGSQAMFCPLHKAQEPDTESCYKHSSASCLSYSPYNFPSQGSFFLLLLLLLLYFNRLPLGDRGKSQSLSKHHQVGSGIHDPKCRNRRPNYLYILPLISTPWGPQLYACASRQNSSGFPCQMMNRKNKPTPCHITLHTRHSSDGLAPWSDRPQTAPPYQWQMSESRHGDWGWRKWRDLCSWCSSQSREMGLRPLLFTCTSVLLPILTEPAISWSQAWPTSPFKGESQVKESFKYLLKTYHESSAILEAHRKYYLI